jgi:hypothetical protein
MITSTTAGLMPSTTVRDQSMPHDGTEVDYFPVQAICQRRTGGKHRIDGLTPLQVLQQMRHRLRLDFHLAHAAS